jgi:drug/metabolite transporter (DMT)-like permease
MLKLIFISTIQSLFLAGGQVLLKLAMKRMDTFSWTWHYFASLLTNLYFFATGVCMGVATVLWFYILRHFELSKAYPMISISYVFGMLGAMLVFHETIPLSRWIGVLCIIIGVCLISK